MDSQLRAWKCLFSFWQHRRCSVVLPAICYVRLGATKGSTSLVVAHFCVVIEFDETISECGNNFICLDNIAIASLLATCASDLPPTSPCPPTLANGVAYYPIQYWLRHRPFFKASKAASSCLLFLVGRREYDRVGFHFRVSIGRTNDDRARIIFSAASRLPESLKFAARYTRDISLRVCHLFFFYNLAPGTL